MGEGAERRQGGPLVRGGGRGEKVGGAACRVPSVTFLSVLCALKPAAVGRCSCQSQRDAGRKTGRQGEMAEPVTRYSRGSL